MSTEQDTTKLKKAKEFGLQLKRLREDQQLTQSQLGDKAGINEKQISHYETGVAKPSLKNLKKLADALGTKLGLLAGKNSEYTEFMQLVQEENQDGEE